MANYYGVRPLVFEIGGILSELVSADNLPFLLNVCETYDCDILSTNCAAYLADHFDALIEEDKVCILEYQHTPSAMLNESFGRNTANRTTAQYLGSNAEEG